MKSRSLRERMLSKVPLHSAWNAARWAPFRGKLFGTLLGRLAPYSATIRPDVVSLRKGYAEVCMRDRPQLRNHLNSLHAIALMNLAEMTTGLAVLSWAGPSFRAILSHLQMDYLKKARGRIIGRCQFEVPLPVGHSEHLVEASLFNTEQTLVATASARWKISSL